MLWLDRQWSENADHRSAVLRPHFDHESGREGYCIHTPFPQFGFHVQTVLKRNIINQRGIEEVPISIARYVIVRVSSYVTF